VKEKLRGLNNQERLLPHMCYTQKGLYKKLLVIYTWYKLNNRFGRFSLLLKTKAGKADCIFKTLVLFLGW
jgi:hypothetical protein